LPEPAAAVDRGPAEGEGAGAAAVPPQARERRMTLVPVAGDPLVDALATELARAHDRISLPAAPPLVFVGYRLADVVRASVEAELGGVVAESILPHQTLGVSVRVGTA